MEGQSLKVGGLGIKKAPGDLSSPGARFAAPGFENDLSTTSELAGLRKEEAASVRKAEVGPEGVHICFYC